MVGCTSCASDTKEVDPRARKALWIALIANAAMFVVEIVGSYKADSVSLKADALDFLGDAANYAVSLFILGMSITIRARASMAKGIIMGLFGIWVLGTAIYKYFNGLPPEANVMGILGFMALLTNLGVAVMLYKFREGDSNMQSVWLCTRNDAIGNIAVMIAAAGVHFTGKSLPDLIVAALMACLGVSSAIKVIALSRNELSFTQDCKAPSTP